MMVNLFYYLIISLVIQYLLFIPAYMFKTDKLTDFSYSLTFFSLAILALYFNEINFSNILLVSMIIIWSLRLGVYLFIRIQHMKKDKRFDSMRNNFFSFLGFWTLQGVSVWVIMISFFLYLLSDSDITYNYIFLLLGFFIWILGIVIESVADYQKFYFNTKSQNKGKWIDQGLWKYSRHPNYFGEILCWIGIFVYSLSSLHGVKILFSLASPLYIIVLLLFVSGIPLLEKSADKKWGRNKSYKKYKKNTNILIPWFQK